MPSKKRRDKQADKITEVQEQVGPEQMHAQLQQFSSASHEDTDMQRRFDLCRTMVQTSVPLRIMQILDRGGVTAADFARVVAYNDEFAGEQGADLLFRSTKPGVTARLFNHMCDAIAVLAFVPGGITIFTDHSKATSTPLHEENEHA